MIEGQTQAQSSGGWVSDTGAALTPGGDAISCKACDVYGIRNIQSPWRLDIAAGNSDPNVGSVVRGSIAFCWDISCSIMLYGGNGVALVKVTPNGTEFRAPNGKLLIRLSNRGIVFYRKPIVR